MVASRSEEFDGLSLAEDETPLTPDLLYRNHFEDVHRWVRHLLGPTLDAEDLTQEVFIVACQRFDEFRGDAKVTTWLFGIARNLVRNHRRKQNLRKFFRARDTHPVDSVATDDPSPLDEMERRRRERRLYEVLDGMKEKYRTVLVLFELEGMDGKAIAEYLQIREATVFVQLHRARKIFLERMRRLENEP